MRPKIAVPVPAGTGESRYHNYFETLAALGAEPIEAAGSVDAGGFDGLVLPGGVDIDPARYGRENTACGEIDRALDALQFAVLDAFVRAKKPVFGICRGHQLINVYFGGTLIQNLETWPRHKWDEVTDADRAHVSAAVAGSWLARLYGERFWVNSAHHQGVETIGRGMVVDQHAEDGVIEAMHHESLPVWCVQWHPERMCLSRARSDTEDGSRAIAWFIERCK